MTERVPPAPPRTAADAAAETTVEELYEDAPCGFLTTAPDGTILRANRTLLRWSGYAADDLVGRRRFYDLLPPGAKIYYETHYAPLLQMQHHVREIALELVRTDGSRLPVLVNAVAHVDADDRPQLVHVTLFDASDRRRYERELLAARAEAETRAAAATALMHVGEAVVLVDDDGIVRVLNAAGERLFGHPADDVLGTRLGEHVPAWREVARRIPVAADAAPVVVPLEVGGATRWVSAAGAPAPDGIVYTLRDVTEERRLDEMRDDIVAIVSHELRTPLSGVLGAAQTLTASGDRLDDATRRALTEMIGEQAERLARILDEILLTERLDAGGVALARSAFDVGEVVSRVAAQHDTGTHRIHVDAPGGLVAEGDAAQFAQVVLNLLDNACKYSAAGTDIRVGAERVRARVRVTVADEGPGIAESDRERVFDKFVRLDPLHTTSPPGTGLGLYIARELVRRMNGRIEVLASERGAAFAVELPAAARAAG